MANGKNRRSEPAFLADARKYSRGDVDIMIDIREHGGGRHKGRLTDLSQSGCRINCPVLIMEHRIISITLPSFAPFEAEIIWKQGDEYGCSFHQGLHEAVFEHILRKFPTLRGRL
ncbi:MAG: PilZ domain-containing protein [Sphingorhabdus sp.]